jgi:hypothetical protein
MTDPNFWGPPLWSTLHTISFDYPNNPTEEEKNNYRNFFHALKYVLPCGTCREHYGKGIEKTYPIEPALKNRDSLSRWLVNFHNVVNKRLNKPVVTYESVKEKYDALSGKCSTTVCGPKEPPCARRKTDNLLYVTIMLLLVVIGMSIYYLPRMKQSRLV